MTKFKNHFLPKFDLVVTRHAPLVEWLIREGHIDADTPVVEHAHADRIPAETVLSGGKDWRVDAGNRTISSGHAFSGDAKHVADAHNAANVRGRHVLGVLPHHLSCHAASFTEVQLDIPAKLRGAELTAEQTGEYARGLHTYVVRRVDVAHQHSDAVAAAWRFVEDQGTSFGAGPGILTYLDRSFRGLEVTVIGSIDEQASAEIIMSRGVWRPMCRGPWLDGLGREVDSFTRNTNENTNAHVELLDPASPKSLALAYISAPSFDGRQALRNAIELEARTLGTQAQHIMMAKAVKDSPNPLESAVDVYCAGAGFANAFEAARVHEVPKWDHPVAGVYPDRLVRRAGFEAPDGPADPGPATFE